METKIAQRQLKELKLEQELEVYAKEKMFSRRVSSSEELHNSYAYFTLRWLHPVFSLQLHEPQKKVKSLHNRLHKLIMINLKRHMIHSHPTHAKDNNFHG